MSAKKADLVSAILDHLIDAVPEVKKTAEEACEFWEDYLDRTDYSVNAKENSGWTPSEQAVYWTGVAEGLSLLASYNSRKIALLLNKKQLEAINEIIQKVG